MTERIIDLVENKDYVKLGEILNEKVAKKIGERIQTKKQEFIESIRKTSKKD